MTKTIILTGGGTAGHVAPNIALIPKLQEAGYQIHYLGTADSFEQRLVSAIPGVRFHVIRAGKLRRYFSLKNFSDPFRVIGGYIDSKKIIKKLKPAAIFSKGGFVTVPVCKAGKHFGVPVVLHESDYTPGLANRLSIKYATKVLTTFEDTLPHTRGKGIFTGTPIRTELFSGSRERGLKFLGFDGKKPVLLVMGGSQGAGAVNDALREGLDQLLERFDIAHLCGKGKVSEAHLNISGYKQFEYVGPELADVFAATDIALSRAGANSIFEFLALALPTVLVPLPLAQSRGDQIQNADYFQKRGYAKVLPQETITKQTLIDTVTGVYDNRQKYIAAMKNEKRADGTQAVLKEIISAAEGK